MGVKRIIGSAVPRKYKEQIKHIGEILNPDHDFHEKLHREEFMRRAFVALRYNGISGDYCEFGCCEGITFRLAYQESRRYEYPCKLWAFDSFCGLPPQALPEDEHPAWIAGTMSTSVEEFRTILRSAAIPEVTYEIVPGYYENTLTNLNGSKAKLPGDVCLAYIDCDLYTSTKTVFEFLEPRIKHGTIVALDDYFCYSATALSGERKACIEFLTENPKFHFAPFVQYGWHGMSFIVEDRRMWGSLNPALIP